MNVIYARVTPPPALSELHTTRAGRTGCFLTQAHTYPTPQKKHELASQGGTVTPLEGPGYTRGTTPSSNTCTITRTLTNADPARPRATSGYYLALSLRVHYYPKTPGTPRA